MPRHRISLPNPARRFVDCFVLGNGKLGATVWGRPDVERIDLNLDTLWSGGPITQTHEPAPNTIGHLRDAIAAGDYATADQLARELQSGKWVQSFQPLGWIEWAYDAVGPAVNECAAVEPVETKATIDTNYSRSLDLAQGIASMSPRPYLKLETFVSAVDDVLVATVSGSQPGAPTLQSLHPVEIHTEESDGITWFTMTGRAPDFVMTHYIPSDNPVTYANDAPDAEGLVAAGMGFACVLAWDPAQRRIIVAGETGFRAWNLRPSADTARLAASARERVASTLSSTTEQLRQRHVTDHFSLFNRCELDLSPSYRADIDVAVGRRRDPSPELELATSYHFADECAAGSDTSQNPAPLGSGGSNPAQHAELFFDLGRYLLIAGSRPGTQPLNLQGMWNIDVRPAWSSNYTTNINAPMNYWSAELTGLGELHQPFLDLVQQLAQAGTRTAAAVYGARGATVHHNTDIWRFTEACGGLTQWVNWPSGLWWLADHLVQHWEFLPAGREADEFLQGQVLPVLRKCALFALDMLVPHDDGQLVVSPSSSPEQAFHIPDASGALTAVTWGATMDQELVHDVFTQAITLLASAPAPTGRPRSAEVAAIEPSQLKLVGQSVRPGSPAGRGAASPRLERRTEPVEVTIGTADEIAEFDDAAIVRAAQAALANLRPPQIRNGLLAEWADDLVPEEVGHRHLSHLYGLFPGSRITAASAPEDFAAAQAALQLRLESGSGYTGWSQAWVLCLAARLRDPELAEQAISTLCGPLSSDSMLDLHPLPGWTDDTAFQIDGNLGGTAGIVECLVQSHDGVVTVLPALPLSWPSGSARGLVVSGGHIIDLSWQHRAVTSLTIHPAADAELTLNLPTPTGNRTTHALTVRSGASQTIALPAPPVVLRPAPPVRESLTFD